MAEARLIVGLGNPGKEYQYTRHNLGFLTVQHLARQHRLRFKRSRICQGLVAEGKIAKRLCYLLSPLTYMNRSGVAIKSFIAKRDVVVKDVLVICDDFQLDFGQLRLRSRGGDGGHNGLSSVIEHLATRDFTRLRIGIGRPINKEDTSDFVLTEFTPKEKKSF